MKKYALYIGAAVLFLAVVACACLMLPALSQNPPTILQTGSNVVTDYTKPDLEYLNFYGLNAFQTELPVLYIDTKGERITKENKIWATLSILEAEADGSAHSILDLPDSSYDITLKYRGASSYSQFDKKQYRIKFYKESGAGRAKNVEFLGMGRNSEWVLNGPFLDKTLIRNRLAYGLARELFEWAPDSRFVELFLDGEYQGVYLAMEPVTNGESRLRLGEFGLASGATAYVVKRDRVDSEENSLNVYGKTAGLTVNDLYIDYPTQSKLTEQQRSWIEEDISRFEEVLYGENFTDPETGYAAYIDVENFVDYFIFNEIFMNNDAGKLSTYSYKELGGKLKLAVWDYNNALDNFQWVLQDFSAFVMADAPWFSRLLQDRAFVDRVIVRYQELRQELFSDASLDARIALHQAELGDAIDRNYAIWGYSWDVKLMSSSTKRPNRNPANYSQAIAQLTDALDQRLDFLDENIETLYNNCIN